MSPDVTPEDPAVPRDAAAATSWDELAPALATTLAGMPTGSFLILITAPAGELDSRYFVQFARVEETSFVGEAVGNAHLRPEHWLTPAQEARLTELGWQAPREEPGVRRNFHREWAFPVAFEEVARLAARTLDEVYRVASPAELRYVYRRLTGGPAIEAPELGIAPEPPRPAAPAAPGRPPLADLRARVEAALRSLLGLEVLVRDAEGDYPIRVGSALMYVRLLGGAPPLVQVFSPIVTDVAVTPALLGALNEINSRILFGRTFALAREVVIAMELTAVDITPDQIGFACVHLGNLADALDDELHGRFGGRTVFETRPRLLN